MHIARTMPSQDVCLSVCLSHADSILSKWFHLSSNFVHRRDRHTILVFAAQNLMAIFWRWPTNAGGMKKSPFSTNISLYLRNDTRYHHSYYGRRIGSRIQASEWYHFHLMTQSIVLSIYDSWASSCLRSCYICCQSHGFTRSFEILIFLCDVSIKLFAVLTCKILCMWCVCRFKM